MPRSNYSSEAEYQASKGNTMRKDFEAAYNKATKKKKKPTGGTTAIGTGGATGSVGGA